MFAGSFIDCGIKFSLGRPGFNSGFFHGSFSKLSHTSDLRIGTPVATLPGACHYRVSAEIGWPGISML